jgi:hypothetical protein
MLAFAALYRTAHPSNPFHRDPKILALAGATLQWWATSQHADGSFDEWYLNERSYCPTAITGAGAALTMHLLRNDLPAPTRAAGIAALARAAAWLDERYNEQVMNQNLAAVVALQGLALLTASDGWHRRAVAKLERVRADQNAEGWFPEYGGMDLGYSALALDLLAAGSILEVGSLATELARTLCRCLVSVQGAGFAVAGRTGSRGTSHAFPYGAIHFARDEPAAAVLAQRWLAGVAQGLATRPEQTDDRYFSYFYLPQFALAFFAAVSHAPPPAPADTPAPFNDLPNAGFVVVRRGEWSLCVNRRLGGALAVEVSDGLPLYHLGYEVTTADGRRHASGALDSKCVVDTYEDGKAITVAARFRNVSSGVPLRRLMIPFQVVVHALRSSRLAAAFQALIKRRMIAPERALSLRLERCIVIGGGVVRVQDKLVPEPGIVRLASLRVATEISMHSPSARHDQGRTAALPPEACAAMVERLNSGKTVSVEFELGPDDWSVKVHDAGNPDA